MQVDVLPNQPMWPSIDDDYHICGARAAASITTSDHFGAEQSRAAMEVGALERRWRRRATMEAEAMKNEWRNGGGRGSLSPSWPSPYTAGCNMTLPIHVRDPDHTLGGRPVSVNTLGGAANNRELLYWTLELSGNSKWIPVNNRLVPYMDRMPIRLHPSISGFLAKPTGSFVTNRRFSPNIVLNPFVGQCYFD